MTTPEQLLCEVNDLYFVLDEIFYNIDGRNLNQTELDCIQMNVQCINNMAKDILRYVSKINEDDKIV